MCRLTNSAPRLPRRHDGCACTRCGCRRAAGGTTRSASRFAQRERRKLRVKQKHLHKKQEAVATYSCVNHTASGASDLIAELAGLADADGRAKAAEDAPARARSLKAGAAHLSLASRRERRRTRSRAGGVTRRDLFHPYPEDRRHLRHAGGEPRSNNRGPDAGPQPRDARRIRIGRCCGTSRLRSASRTQSRFPRSTAMPYSPMRATSFRFSSVISIMTGGRVEKYRNPHHYDFSIANRGFDYLIRTISDRNSIWPSRKLVHYQLFSQPPPGPSSNGSIAPRRWIGICTPWRSISALIFTSGQPQRVGPRSDYRTHYTDALVEIVSRTWGRELELFGFELRSSGIEIFAAQAGAESKGAPSTC